VDPRTDVGQLDSDTPTIPGVARSMRLERLGWVLLGSACVWALAIGCRGEADFHMARPELLAAPALWLAWPTRRDRLRCVQTLTFLYLMAVVVLAGCPVVWEVGFPGHTVAFRISRTVVFVALAGAGWWITHVRPSPGVSMGARRVIVAALAGAVCVLGVHMLALWAVLQPLYGYGWGEDRAVLGRVGLYVLTVVFLMPLAESNAARGVIGLGCGLLFFLKG